MVCRDGDGVISSICGVNREEAVGVRSDEAFNNGKTLYCIKANNDGFDAKFLKKGKIWLM